MIALLTIYLAIGISLLVELCRGGVYRNAYVREIHKVVGFSIGIIILWPAVIYWCSRHG